MIAILSVIAFLYVGIAYTYATVKIPNDVVYEALKYLNQTDQHHISLTCRKFNSRQKRSKDYKNHSYSLKRHLR